MFNSTDVFAILGRRGSGKTTLSRNLQGMYPRVVVFDRLQEYTGERGRPGSHVVQTWKGFGDALKATAHEKKFRLIFQFEMRQENESAMFDEACWVLNNLGDVCIVVEEVWNYAHPHFLPGSLREILLTGRHRNISLITTSQRPAEVHKTLISQAHHRMFGLIDEPNDLKYLRDFLGDEIARLPGLKTGHFLHYSAGKTPKIIIADPKRR